jgi:hypothetical protein
MVTNWLGPKKLIRQHSFASRLTAAQQQKLLA